MPVVFRVFRHSLMGYIRIVRHWDTPLYATTVIKSSKSVRAFGTQIRKALPGKSHPEKSQSNVATWLQNRYKELIGTYEELSGVKEVRIAQEDVVKIQEKLQQTQEKRREILLKLLAIRNNVQRLNNDIHAVEKSNPHYLELVRQQIELIQNEREAKEYFDLMDTSERDLFTHLTSAVRTSHEKERSQAENSKYFSMILTMIGAVLGILGTTLSYHFRNRQYKNISEQDLQKLLEKSVESTLQRKEKKESWTNYFYRHGSNIYRFFVPKS
ncbi:mitochondrial potassium channel-like isoform X2 [Phlebotomus papatasi]|uniref:mitochondrial potassium channel-like isoform X2 n=1 Tax=Phlebotomus papatasi TaxID=29031 RepID=UPI002483CC21|nr:mitochondrial potassium channel-like isoform X2 [Phlebotomus papatasi]